MHLLSQVFDLLFFFVLEVSSSVTLLELFLSYYYENTSLLLFSTPLDCDFSGVSHISRFDNICFLLSSSMLYSKSDVSNLFNSDMRSSVFNIFDTDEFGPLSKWFLDYISMFCIVYWVSWLGCIWTLKSSSSLWLESLRFSPLPPMSFLWICMLFDSLPLFGLMALAAAQSGWLLCSVSNLLVPCKKVVFEKSSELFWIYAKLRPCILWFILRLYLWFLILELAFLNTLLFCLLKFYPGPFLSRFNGLSESCDLRDFKSCSNFCSEVSRFALWLSATFLRLNEGTLEVLFIKLL